MKTEIINGEKYLVIETEEDCEDIFDKLNSENKRRFVIKILKWKQY